jgi:peptide/nickel transport system ATP-binding protein
MIDIKNVSMKFDKKEVLRDISFSVKSGSKIAIIGDSGSGKSTLAKIIVGLIKPTKGEVFLNDVSVSKFSRKDKGKIIQMVFQHPQSSFDPKRKIGFQLKEPYKIHKIKIENEIDDLLNFFSLDSNLLDRYPFQISGGEAQRLSIIKCLTLNPGILILDEPTSMLDVSIQAEIINFLLDIQKIRKMTFVFVSHDLELVSKVCDEIIVIDDKKIIESGNVNEILNNPQKEYTKELINSFKYFYE